MSAYCPLCRFVICMGASYALIALPVEEMGWSLTPHRIRQPFVAPYDSPGSAKEVPT